MVYSCYVFLIVDGVNHISAFCYQRFHCCCSLYSNYHLVASLIPSKYHIYINTFPCLISLGIVLPSCFSLVAGFHHWLVAVSMYKCTKCFGRPRLESSLVTLPHSHTFHMSTKNRHHLYYFFQNHFGNKKVEFSRFFSCNDTCFGAHCSWSRHLFELLPLTWFCRLFLLEHNANSRPKYQTLKMRYWIPFVNCLLICSFSLNKRVRFRRKI